MTSRRVYVAVVGDAAPSADSAMLQAAEEVGRGLARAGAVLVCGGTTGVMEAACRGASSEGGLTIGLLPGADRSEANDYVEVAIPTGFGEGRNLLVARAADAVVAIGGGYGTLSEVGFALKLGKPVVGLETWELFREGKKDHAIERAESALAAVDRALRAARRAVEG